ncbi:unnamed protein product [Cuscuta campestris]|uniref:Uncharacterized protein n=1 Tax=Cuscuta campestris TaxID=132261 RepID=A0A484L068_9ASTE|nr:unnamed protein product [Cuscuta campestris]
MMGLTGDEKCLLFFQTLHSRAAEWFHNLPTGEIDSFDELAEVFQEKFKENCTKRKTFTYLSTAGKREHEDLTKFLTRWKDEVDKVSSKREAEQCHPKGRTTVKKEVELPGRLKPEVMEAKQKNQWIRSEGQPADQNKKKEAAGKEHLQVIYRGPEGGDSASQRKKWGRELYVGTVALDPRQKQTRREPITFTDRDLHATEEDHNDPLVITMEMGGVDVSRVLVDTGSSVNVLYLEAFEKLKLCRTRLEPLKTPLSGFTRDSVEAEGSILLTCELGTGDKVIQNQTRFVVVNIKCVHNAILGRPGINKVCGIISMAHLCMKFYTPGGIGQVRGDQKKVRSCYLKAVKKMTNAFERVTLVSQEEDWSKLEPGLEPEEGPSHVVELWWDMAVDGASRPKGCGAGIVFTTPEGFKIYHTLVFNFKLTNNEAEYETLAGGLRLARALGIKRMKIWFDSSLDVRQVNGEMEVKKERLARYSDLIRALLRELEEFCLTRIPRSENTDADMLPKLMQACPEHVSELAKIEILDQSSADRLEVAAIQQCQSSAVGVIGADDEWRYNLMEYLMTGQKPDDEERARKVVLQAPRFQILDSHLYKRAIGGPLLHCLTNPEVERVIAKVHEGVCAAHHMSRTLAQRIIWLGYYWPTIVRDCERVTSRRTTGETPFVLTYGCEVRLPIEAEFPTLREVVYQIGQNKADHMAELNLVEERRTMAAVKMAGYQQSVLRYHDNRVGLCYFQVHDEVLRRRDATKPNEGGKLVRN